MRLQGCFVFLFLLSGSSQGFSRLFENSVFEKLRREGEGADDLKPCETVRVMPRIVGGSPVVHEESTPYIAAIAERLSNGSLMWFCGGSIMSPTYILTAAHCLSNRNADFVRVGSLSLNKRPGENDYAVEETFIHPKYKAPKSYHDIALIKLKDGIQFASNIRPICLAEKDDKFEGRKARVIGWGAEEVGGDGSQKLKKVEVQIVSNSHCDQAYQNSSISERTFPNGVKDGQLCAGSPTGGKDACQGDSGGPLVLADSEGVTLQIGVVSTGAGCGASMYPGVYTRVSSYYSWIQKKVKKDPLEKSEAPLIFTPSREIESY